MLLLPGDEERGALVRQAARESGLVVVSGSEPLGGSMPQLVVGAGGRDAAEALRAVRERGIDAPAILIVDSDPLPTAERLLELGVVACLPSPLPSAHFAFAARAALRHGESLRRAQAAEEAITRALEGRDETLAIVSHDLRGPLGTVSMAADLLLDAGMEEAHSAHLRVIKRSVVRMTRLLQDVIDAMNLERGRLSITASIEAIAPLLVEVCDRYGARAEEAGLLLDHHEEADLPPVLVDHDRILEVLGHLVANALKFTPSGCVVVRAEHHPDGVRVAVADTGPGIAPGSLPFVFDRFYRDPENRAAGPGLGLTIARGIVEAHGGTMGVESEPGRGSTFWFTLPRAKC